MLFSIVCAIFNVERYFRRGIQSILNQTCPDFELVLVDDGSTDSCPDLCREYAANDSRIRVIRQSNRGVGEARNTGVDAARGRYVLFFDIDDVLHFDALTRLDNILHADAPQVLVFGYREINQLLNTSMEFRFDSLDVQSNRDLAGVYVDGLSGLRFNNGFVWNKVYDRAFLQSNSLRSPNLPIQQDEVFNVEVFKRAERVMAVKDILYDYYVYNVGNNGSRYLPQRLDIYRAVRDSLLSLTDYWQLNDLRFEAYVLRRFVDGVLLHIDRNVFHPTVSISERRLMIDEILHAPDVCRVIARLRELEALPRGLIYAAFADKSVDRFLIARRYARLIGAGRRLARKLLH